MKKIGMIGLGAMGHSIAENLMANGYSMVLYDIRPEAYQDLIEKGAEGADSLRDLGSKTNTVLLMVNAYAHCCSALEGLLETFENGVVVLLSTVAPDEARELEKMVQKKGCGMIDCPVSGGTSGAKAGTLTLMVGCNNSLHAAYLPMLNAFGSKVFHVGQNVGDGQTIKAINQLLVGVHMCATAEAFTIAKQCGLDLNLVYDVICSGAGMSKIFENRGKFLIDRDFSTRSTLQIQLKDTNIACKTANAVGAPSFLASTARELFKLALNKYPATDDSLEVVRVYEDLCKEQQAK